jgi:hypothetical protein
MVTSALCGIAALTAYVLTLTDTVSGGDSGELISVAYHVGIAHPPGYPLYTLLAKVTTLVPLGGIAWRVSLFSALCNAAAAMILCRAVILWTGSRAAGVLAAGAFAFSPLVWPYAIVAEVFALNNLFVAGLVYFSVRGALERQATGTASTQTLYLAAFWLGLGFSNHHTLVFFGIPFGLYLLYLRGGGAASPRFLAGLAAAVALGFLPYLLLVVRGDYATEVSWGHTSTWDGLVTHVLRREYGTFRLADASVGEAGTFWPRFVLFWRDTAFSTFFLVVPLGAAAAAALFGWGASKGPPSPPRVTAWSVPRIVALLWTAALLFYLVVFCSLSNVRLDDPLHVYMQQRFWQQGLVIVCALMALGWTEIARLLPKKAAAPVGWVLAIGLSAALVAEHFPDMLRHRNPVVRSYGEAMLASVSPRGMLVVSSDEAIGSVRYLQQVEGLRRDVRVVPVGIMGLPWFRGLAARHWPELVVPPPGFTFREFLDANAARTPVFVANRVPWLQTLEPRYSLWPAGLAEQALPKGQEPPPGWVERAEASLARVDPAPALRMPVGSWEHGIGVAYWKLYERLGTAVVQTAARRGDDAAAHERAVRVLQALAASQPSVSATVYKNLGVAYHVLSRTRPDATARMVTAWRRYLEVAPPNDPDLGNIRVLITQAEARLKEAPAPRRPGPAR